MGSGHVHEAPLEASYFGRLDARAKILAIVPAVFLVNLLPEAEWPAVAAVGIIFLVLASFSRHGAWTVFKRAALALPFVLFVVVTLPFAAAGTEIFSINLGVGRLVATDEGLTRAAEVALRAGTSILGIMLLSATTEAPALFKGLRAMGFPKAFVAVLAIVYRYVFEMAGELVRLRRAAAARGFEIKNFRAAPRLADMSGALLVRSVARSERVHHAMAARGYDGEVRTLSHGAFGLREAMFLGAFYILISSAVVAVIYA